MRSKVKRPCAPSTFASNHAVTRGTSTPFGHLVITQSSPGPVAQVGEGTAAGTLPPMSIDVTDATFPTEVVERSKQVPVVVDLWAEWCGPCKTLGPILEKVIDETGGKVVLAKVDVDANPQTAAAFQVQGIPGRVRAEGRQGRRRLHRRPARGERAEFVAGLLPTEEEDALAALLAAGDEASLRQALELEPGHEGAIVALAELLVAEGRGGQGRGARAARADPRVGRDPPGRGAGAHRRRHPTTTSPTSSTAAARVKDDDDARQRVRRPARADGPDDPAHRRLPQARSPPSSSERPCGSSGATVRCS